VFEPAPRFKKRKSALSGSSAAKTQPAGKRKSLQSSNFPLPAAYSIGRTPAARISHDDRNAALDQLGRERRQSFLMIGGKAAFDREIAAVDKAGIAQASA
jgi:hypothetical protein